MFKNTQGEHGGMPIATFFTKIVYHMPAALSSGFTFFFLRFFAQL